MDQATIQHELKKYLSRIKKYIGDIEAYLVGSYAKGEANADSDVDVLIISRDFSKYDADERSKILYRASVGFPYDLHVFGVTPQEIDNASHLTTLGQIREGAKIRIQE